MRLKDLLDIPTELLPPTIAAKLQVMREIRDQMDSIVFAVAKACDAPVSTTGLVDLTVLPPTEALRMYAIKYVLESFGQSLDVTASADSSLHLQSRTARRAAPLRQLLGMAPDLDNAGLLDFMKHRRDSIVLSLADLVDRLSSAGSQAYAEYMSEQSRMDADSLGDLMDVAPRVQDSPEIKFVRAEDIRVLLPRAAAVPAPAPQVVASGSTSGSAAPPSPYQARAEALEERVIQLQTELADRDQRRREEESPSAQLRELNRSLRARVRGLELQAEKHRAATSSAVPQVSFPSSWDALQRFADEHLAGRVVLTAKAQRAARRSEYQDIAFAYEVLLMLAQDYVPMRRGEEGARERFLSTSQRLKVDVGPVGAAADRHLTSEAYSATHLGRRISATLHVRGSSSRDPREGFRLYFEWVEDPDGDAQVVVISFPAHLDNTLS